MKLIETIIIGVVFGVIGGFLTISVVNIYNKWRLERKAFKELESYKDKVMYQTLNGKDIPLIPYLREQREKNRRLKGGIFNFFKKNGENKPTTEEPVTNQHASSYGNNTPRSNTAVSSTTNTNISSGRTTTKKETSNWDFH